ncbi:RecE-like recombination exonuclease [Gordonia phage Daredevil]|uniref:RecE-like exonuclease n=1 Tax=Gordonia phage Daredevil TaxID=2283286 RepID=A0A345MIU1_9CAUD|nr:RecE-like recombination exonuclease [Gordonia phage Daredevil]AXH70472.1 RecE-like exonuclease [Gordonia phage Daredevil]
MRDLEVNELINGNAVKIGNWPPGSPEWHAARAHAIGGSEISAVVGLNPWTSHFSLYYNKRDGIGLAEETAIMRWGTNHEPTIYEFFKTTDGTFGDGLQQLAPGCTMTTGDTFRDINRAWMNVNPDGLIWDEQGNCVALLEIKTSARGDGWGPQGSKQIPIYYLCQVLYYAAVMKVEKMIVAVLISGWDYRTYELEFSAEDAQILIDAGQEFMDNLAAGVEPSLDKHGATYEIVRQMHPEIDMGEGITLEPDVAARYLAAVKADEAAKAERLYMESQVLQLAGRAQYVYVERPGEDEFDIQVEKVARRQKAGRGNKPPYLRYLGLEEPYPESIREALDKVAA